MLNAISILMKPFHNYLINIYMSQGSISINYEVVQLQEENENLKKNNTKLRKKNKILTNKLEKYKNIMHRLFDKTKTPNMPLSFRRKLSNSRESYSDYLDRISPSPNHNEWDSAEFSGLTFGGTKKRKYKRYNKTSKRKY